MKLLKSEDSFCLVWAKKIKAVNLLGGQCNNCGNKNIFVLEFHHNFDKDFNIIDLKGYRWSTLEKELKKCIVLCANCHSELHYKGTRNGKIKEKFLLNRKLTVCYKCGYSGKNFSSLSFHHLGDKKFSVTAALIRQISVSAQDLEDELEKCIIICKNCHRIEHSKVDQFNRLKDIIFRKVYKHKELPMPLNEKLVVKMYSDGKSQKEIYKLLGCAKSTISEILKRNNCRKKRQVKIYNKICPSCNNLFSTKNKILRFCSKKCMGLAKRKIRPCLNELLEMRKSMSLKTIADKLGVSPVAVYKWCKEPI